MRRRSSGAIALGAVALLASWAFGSTPAAVIGLGFLLAGVGARVWASRVRGSIVLERHLLPGERIEGAEVRIAVRVFGAPRLPGTGAFAHQRIGIVDRECRLRGAVGELSVEGLGRGRHRLAPLRVTLTDPLGLEAVETTLDDGTAIVIRPRIPALDSLFSEHGALDSGAARTAFRRPTGFEIHAVREYAPGEPLRSVHWPSTARRGRLMVKELDDAPRDDLVVLLDQDPDAVAGPAGDSSFDAAVRAAGGLALAHAHRSRRVFIVGTAAGFGPVRVQSTALDWEAALDALAEVAPAAGLSPAAALRSASGPVAHAREIVVLTARPDRVVDTMLELRGRGRAISLVVIASESFAGRPRRAPEPATLRAGANAIPVAVVSAGESLVTALSGLTAGSRSA